MRIQIDQFQGMTPRPDPAEVGSRFSRNITFGPGGTWIETRPGTEQLTTTTQPSAQPEDDFPNDPEFASAYRLKDDRIESLVLVQATRDDTAEVGRRSNAPRVVCPVTFMPLSVVGFGPDEPNPDPPEPTSATFEYWGLFFYNDGFVHQEVFAVESEQEVEENDLLKLLPREAKAYATYPADPPAVPAEIGPNDVIDNYVGGRAAPFTLKTRLPMLLWRFANPTDVDIKFRIVPVDVPANEVPIESNGQDEYPWFYAFTIPITSPGSVIRYNDAPDPDFNWFLWTITDGYPELEDAGGLINIEETELPSGFYIHIGMWHDGVLGWIITPNGENPVYETDTTVYPNQVIHYFDLEYWPVSNPGSVSKIRFGIQLFEDPPP